MKKYLITIRETLSKDVYVMAENEEAAKEIAIKSYENAATDFVLSPQDNLVRGEMYMNKLNKYGEYEDIANCEMFYEI